MDSKGDIISVGWAIAHTCRFDVIMREFMWVIEKKGLSEKIKENKNLDISRCFMNCENPKTQKQTISVVYK